MKVKKPRNRIESQHAQALFAWVQLNTITRPELEYLTHIPSGGMRDRRVGRDGTVFSPSGLAAKKEGVRKGLPDYLLFVRRGHFVGLAFELKAGKGVLSPEQRAWSVHLAAQGWCVVGPWYDWELATRAILDYLSLAPPPALTPPV